MKALLSMAAHAILAKWIAETGALLRSLRTNNNNRKETPR